MGEKTRIKGATMKNKAKSTVLDKFPNARAERQRGNDNKSYWLIRVSVASVYFAEGTTEAQAWRKAAEKIANGITL